LSRVILTFLTYGSLAIAQPARDDWKAKRFVTGELTRSLADAPLTARERAQIYRVVDNRAASCGSPCSQVRTVLSYGKLPAEAFMTSPQDGIGVLSTSSFGFTVGTAPVIGK